MTFLTNLERQQKGCKKMLVSAVITTHKREPNIVERALKSVLSQTYKDIEILVVDDSPAD